ncbi:MAG: hypothetical protein IKS15_01675 [Opitutales bacterium]|nr:hypothetical protein [Opitutales bacterium]
MIFPRGKALISKNYFPKIVCFFISRFSPLFWQLAHRNKQEAVKSDDSKKGDDGVYLNILDRVAFFDPGTIRGLLLVYAANVPVFFYMAVGAQKALKLGEMRAQKRERRTECI